MSLDRTLTEIIRLAMDEMREQVHTSLPGTVQTFYPSTQTADIQLAIRRPYIEGTTGLKAYETLPVLPQVPIAYPRGGGFVMAFPLNSGDEVTVVFRMYSDAEWRQTGQLSSPTDATVHGMYCVAMPCNTVTPVGDPISSDLVIGIAGKSAQIRIPSAGGEIDLGASPTGFVALANLVSGELTKIKNALASAAAPSGGGPVTYGTPYTTVGNVAATVAKAE